MLLGTMWDDQEFDVMKTYVSWMEEFLKLSYRAQLRVLRYLQDRYPESPLVKADQWRKKKPAKPGAQAL